MVDLIDIKRIEDIVVKAHFQATKFEKDPTNARAKEQFLSRVQELAELVEASSYPSTWILKPLPEAPKPPQSGGNGTSLTGTAPTGTAPAGVTAGSFFGDYLVFDFEPRARALSNPFLRCYKPGRAALEYSNAGEIGMQKSFEPLDKSSSVKRER
jgi:hypothetical protein